MNTFEGLWQKLARSKEYREEFVAAQLKRGIPFQIRALLRGKGWKQEELAKRARLTQGVISRAMNANYGNLTLNTLIRIAAGFDIAFIGHFVPFSELDECFTNLSKATKVLSFEEEDAIVTVAGTYALRGQGLRFGRTTASRHGTNPPPKKASESEKNRTSWYLESARGKNQPSQSTAEPLQVLNEASHDLARVGISA